MMQKEGVSTTNSDFDPLFIAPGKNVAQIVSSLARSTISPRGFLISPTCCPVPLDSEGWMTFGTGYGNNLALDSVVRWQSVQGGLVVSMFRASAGQAARKSILNK